MGAVSICISGIKRGLDACVVDRGGAACIQNEGTGFAFARLSNPSIRPPEGAVLNVADAMVGAVRVSAVVKSALSV